ncbi:ABC transporter ATP-binding protein [Bacillus sp. DX4.1]|uniref:ABC transporter ATP-binding protein n=1 Tax=Bacillus sp. DX4.1 TaxID=3055867 RepID=UPI00259FF116|nr:ABC transporter ATP-binding protein [Bacillus sp. DX4.1]MDM5186895.1 ABC transporter ATP-binding protein [Bacillus sp. DX4.1]
MSIIKVEQLETGYEKNTIYKDLTLELPKGKITTIIGPNGCGKSTLLKTIGRMLKPTKGQVYLDGKDMQKIHTRDISKKLSVLSQNPVAPYELQVEELIAYGRYPHRKGFYSLTTEDKEMIEWALEKTGLLQYRSREIGSLSGGQRQKVWLALALAQDTDVLLLDEPTTFLDLCHQIEILNTISELNLEAHRTIVMVLHDINHAARFSDHMIAMKDGKVVAEGTPSLIMKEDVLRELFQIDARIINDPYDGVPVCIGYQSISGLSVAK